MTGISEFQKLQVMIRKAVPDKAECLRIEDQVHRAITEGMALREKASQWDGMRSPEPVPGPTPRVTMPAKKAAKRGK